LVGLYDGKKRVTTLIAGPGVTPTTEYRYQVGTVLISPPPSQINVVTRIGGRVITSAENGNCVSGVIYPNGSQNTAGCVRAPVLTSGSGTYSVRWLSGYPVGADTTPPAITPGQIFNGSPLTFYIDFSTVVQVDSGPVDAE